MLGEYMDKAMAHTQLKRMEDGAWFAEIPDFEGLWASAPTEQDCRKELRDVLEGWILLHIADHEPLPMVDGMILEVGKPV